MKLYKTSVLYLAVWCHFTLEVTSAPSVPFKPSQSLRSPLDSSDQLAISYLQKEALREKRGSASGSGDILNHIKATIGQGIKNKIGQIAKSSAGASAYFSKSSSAHHHTPPEHGHYPHPHYPPYYHHPHHGYEEHHGKGVDFWGLKKSVLSTLLQAVKAIKGGVIAIKGQLIKGGGHLLNTKGKILRHGGDALTSIGKSIASSAFLLAPTAEEEVEVIHDTDHHHHPHHSHHPQGVYEYTGPTAPVVPLSGPPASYGQTGHGYYQNTVHEGKPSPQQHDGLIILRKIPKHLNHASDTDVDNTNDEQQHDDHHETSNYQHYHQQHQQEHYEHHQDQQDVQESQKTPAFRPISDTIVPKMKNLVTSVFHSSSSPASKPPPTDNTISHSAHNTAVKVKPNKSNAQVQPQQASIGSLVNYLEYIRALQKGTKPKDVNKGKTVMYVTPAPPNVVVNPSKSIDQIKSQKGQGTSTSSTTKVQTSVVTHQDLKKETVALEQQLQQLHSLQQLQQQLQMMYPYAGGNTQSQIQTPGVDYGPVMIDLPANADLATALAQYQIVPEGPQQHQQQQYLHAFPQNPYVQDTPQFIQVQPSVQTQQLLQIPQHQQQQQQQQLQNLYQIEEPLEEAESSNAFLIHYPDEDSSEVQGRSLRSNPNRKPKTKRHSHIPTTKLKRLSHLQQMQMMQQQLYHPQLPKKPPTIDIVRSLKFFN